MAAYYTMYTNKSHSGTKNENKADILVVEKGQSITNAWTLDYGEWDAAVSKTKWSLKLTKFKYFCGENQKVTVILNYPMAEKHRIFKISFI